MRKLATFVLTKKQKQLYFAPKTKYKTCCNKQLINTIKVSKILGKNKIDSNHTTMATNVTDPYTDIHDDESGKMVMAAKYGGWDTVWEILNRKPYLVDCIPEERTWAILHQAVWWKDAIAVKKILAVPGCDSEQLTKNGLRPLDIETTAEIRKLLEQHIAQVNGWEETPQTEFIEINKNEMPQGDIIETNKKETLPVKSKFSKMSKKTSKPISNGSKQSFKKEIPSTNKQIYEEKTYDELVEEGKQHAKVITKEAKSRNWKTLFSLLDKWKNLVNKVDSDTGMAPLHYAAEANDVEAVQKILYYPACDPAVKTAKRSSYGAGKTAAKITTSPEVKAAIRWKEKKLEEKHSDIPAFVSIHDSDLIMMRYTGHAMDEHRNEICDSNLNTEFLKVFPEMGWFIFDFINTGDANWKRAKQVVLKEIYGFDAVICDELKPKTQDNFYKRLIYCYTTNHIYKQLKTELKEQAINQNNTKFKAYTALMNALLFKNSLKLPTHNKTTYRAAGLSDLDYEKYTVGKEFAWLTFASSSGMESVARNHARNYKYNCIFKIDNSQSSIWSPKGIAEISAYPHEDEYLYPCGAQFQVTNVKKEKEMTIIHLKLICRIEQREFVPIVGNNLENKANEIKKSIANSTEKREEFESRNTQLLKIRNEIENNKCYETQIIQNIVKKKNLKTNNAFNCTKCKHTCHYPCPETDMESGGCIMSGPLDEQHCKKCPKICKFIFHKRENYRYIKESTTQTRINQQMKAKFEKAKLQEESEEKRVEAKQRELDAAIKTAKTKLAEWDKLRSHFEEKVNQEQAAARADSVEMLKCYANNKALVQIARLQLEENELI